MAIEVAGRQITTEEVNHTALGYLWGRYAPWWALLLKGTVIYLVNMKEINGALEKVPTVVSHLEAIRQKNPRLYAQVIETARQQLLKEIPASLKPEDPAFLLGRLLRAHAREATPAQMLRVGLQVVALVLTLHLPSAVARALAHAAEVHAVPLLKAEVAVALEGATPAAQAALAEQLQHLQRAAQALQPELDRVAQLFGVRPGPGPAGVLG